MQIERFIIKETQKPGGPPLVSGYLESKPLLQVLQEAEVLFVGARRLLGEGYEPTALLTTRWQGKNFDNFAPIRIGWLAERRIREPDERDIEIIKWEPSDVD